MTRFVLDADLASRLAQAAHSLEVCDPTGRVVGTFFPNPSDSPYANVVVPFTDEELDAAEQEPGGYSLAEILAELEKLP